MARIRWFILLAWFLAWGVGLGLLLILTVAASILVNLTKVGP